MKKVDDAEKRSLIIPIFSQLEKLASYVTASTNYTVYDNETRILKCFNRKIPSSRTPSPPAKT
jgi:hypothetical protein